MLVKTVPEIHIWHINVWVSIRADNLNLNDCVEHLFYILTPRNVLCNDDCPNWSRINLPLHWQRTCHYVFVMYLKSTAVTLDCETHYNLSKTCCRWYGCARPPLWSSSSCCFSLQIDTDSSFHTLAHPVNGRFLPGHDFKEFELSALSFLFLFHLPKLSCT